MKWRKETLIISGLLVLTVVNAVMCFLPFKDSADGRTIVHLQKQMAKYTRKP